MSLRRDFIKFPLAAATTPALALCGASALAQPAPVTLLNVSYDPTRELYVEFNAAFAQSTGRPRPART
jgi:ABC-type sulfate transport system substrate-binding protein